MSKWIYQCKFWGIRLGWFASIYHHSVRCILCTCMSYHIVQLQIMPIISTSRTSFFSWTTKNNWKWKGFENIRKKCYRYRWGAVAKFKISRRNILLLSTLIATSLITNPLYRTFLSLWNYILSLSTCYRVYFIFVIRLRGWHKSSRLVHFFRAIYMKEKNVEIFF